VYSPRARCDATKASSQLRCLLIEQHAQLGDGESRMGVVDLHPPVMGNSLTGNCAESEACRSMFLEAAAHKEVLLLEPQAPPSAVPSW